MNWIPLTSETQLEEIKNADSPALIFKHSTRCSISSAAKDRLERQWNDSKAEGLKAYYLDLLNYRPVSNKIADDFGVEHQSPQVLLIKNGKSVYDTSHMAIGFDGIVSKL